MAGSRVGSLYYEVLLDPSGFARGASKIKKEQKALQQVLNSMAANMDPREKQRLMHQAQLESIRNARRAGKLSREQAREMWNASVADHKRAMDRIVEQEKRAADRIIAEKKRAAKAASFFGRSKDQLNRIGQGILMATSRMYAFNVVVRMAFGFVNSFAKAVSNAYMQVRTLSNLFGGATGMAEEMRAKLQDYAQATAFSVEQTMAIAVQLKALGFAADEIIPKIKMMGKLSFGDPQKMKFIAKAMSDVRAMGRLMSREVMQFANQGIPVLGELSKMYGVTTAQLKDMIEAGQVSAKDTEEALERIAARYGDTDTLGLETSQGQLQRLKEEWTAFQEQFPAFEDMIFLLVKSLADVIEFLTDMKKKWNESDNLVFKFVGYMTNIAGAIRDMADTSSDLWLIWAKFWGAVTGNDAMERQIMRQREFNKVAKKAADEAEKRRQKEEEARIKELKHIEAMQANQKKLADMELRRARAAGDDVEVARLEAIEKIVKAYKEGQELALRGGDGELLPGQDPNALGQQAAELMKQQLAQEAAGKGQKERAERKKSIFALPKEIFKQNSVAEFRYLQEMRTNARREAEAERRHQESLQNDTDNTQAITDAINSINTSQEIQDFNAVGV